MANPLLTLVTDADESLRVQQAFEMAFRAGAEVLQNHAVGWQGGSVQAEVLWQEGAGIWGVFLQKPPGGKRAVDRFWTCFGVADPSKAAMLHITVEMNPPHRGENRRTAGVFLRNEAARYYIGHSGKIGGGRPGIGQDKFREFSHYLRWQEIGTPTGPREVVVFGPLEGGELLNVLAPFVHAVAEFKKSAVVSSSPPR